MTQQSDSLTTPLAVFSPHQDCLPEIFREEINLAVWERPVSQPCSHFAQAFTRRTGSMERFMSLSKEDSAASALPQWALELEGADAFVADVDELIAMFSCLFEPEAVGLRLHVLQRTMCPRFHVDQVAARMICTYQGAGTQWLPEALVKRPGTPGPLPAQPIKDQDIRQIATAAVAILKGEAWEGNEGRGLIHRSPPPEDKPRLVVGLDWL
ncbi:MAG: DUF1826 domain-containing protein [Halomonadaceae bacterium]|nr:MAG: DUF1826 domain-containing protein [Halomonadaceae bacterium]